MEFMKYFILGTLFLSTLFPLNCNFKQLTCINSQTAFVFDFHGVVAEFKLTKAIQGFFKNSHKAKFLKKLLNQKKGHSIEEAFLDEQGYISKEDISTLNPYVINQDLIETIKQLKNSGYPVFLCSNIGEKMFEAYQEKYPNLFGEDGLFCGCWHGTKENNYINKNNPRAFV